MPIFSKSFPSSPSVFVFSDKKILSRPSKTITIRALNWGDSLIIFIIIGAIFYLSGLGNFLSNYGDGSWQLSYAAQTPAVKALAALPITVDSPPPYERKYFGLPWADVDQNGCDTRNDILQRDLLQVRLGVDHCRVLGGLLNDPYTGQPIWFKRGPKTSTAVQIDHVVALSDAWKSGAWKLTPHQRLRFANDPLNLLAVSGPANQEKSDKNADQWLPSNPRFRCTYAIRQIRIKYKWHLTVSRAEKRRLATIVPTCPDQHLFTPI